MTGALQRCLPPHTPARASDPFPPFSDGKTVACAACSGCKWTNSCSCGRCGRFGAAPLDQLDGATEQAGHDYRAQDAHPVCKSRRSTRPRHRSRPAQGACALSLLLSLKVGEPERSIATAECAYCSAEQPCSHKDVLARTGALVPGGAQRRLPLSPRSPVHAHDRRSVHPCSDWFLLLGRGESSLLLHLPRPALVKDQSGRLPPGSTGAQWATTDF